MDDTKLDSIMVQIYLQRILRGSITIDDVPDRIRKSVERELD